LYVSITSVRGMVDLINSISSVVTRFRLVVEDVDGGLVVAACSLESSLFAPLALILFVRVT